MEEYLEVEIPTVGLEVDDAGVEGIYTALWTAHGGLYVPRPYSNCSSCAPRTHADFRLTVTSQKFAVLSVTLETYDSTGNYPGRKIENIGDNIAINPGSRRTLRQAGGDCSVTLEQVAVKPGVCQMVAGFTAPWKAQRDGKLCHSGQINFRRTFDLKRVGLVEDSEVTAGFA